MMNKKTKTNFKFICKDLFKKTNIKKANANNIEILLRNFEYNIIIRNCFERMGSLFRATHENILKELNDFNWDQHGIVLSKQQTTQKDVFDKTTFMKTGNIDLYDALISKPIEFSNNYSHFEPYESKVIFNEIRFKQPKLEESIKFLKSIYDALTLIIKLEDSSYKSISSFDDAIYNDQFSMWKYNSQARILDVHYCNKPCLCCQKGNLVKNQDIKPNDKFDYKHGPYLLCSNKTCGAILSSNERLKVLSKDNKCDKCKNDVKETIDMRTKETYLLCSNQDCLFEKSWKRKSKQN